MSEIKSEDVRALAAAISDLARAINALPDKLRGGASTVFPSSVTVYHETQRAGPRGGNWAT